MSAPATLDVELEVTDVLTREVEDGVRLYGIATGEFTAEDGDARAQRWLSLFRDNPLGGGLFAIARHKGELAGFVSLIDIEMLVDGAPVRAGKAEFWVTRPEALKLGAPGSKDRLPWALFERLRSRAADYGYRAIETVSPPATRYLRRAGDTCVVPLLTTYAAPKLSGGPIGWRVGKLLARTRLKQLRDRLRRITGGNAESVVEIDRLDEEVGYTYQNALISSGAGMINLRFPPEKHLKVLLRRPDAKPLLFVFSRPAAAQPTRLLHASGYPPFREFAAVLGFVLEKVVSACGSGVVIDLPRNLAAQDYDLGPLGFSRSHGQLIDCYIRDLAEGAPTSRVSDWHASHGHMGFYGHIS